jgi:hypothetical protein
MTSKYEQSIELMEKRIPQEELRRNSIEFERKKETKNTNERGDEKKKKKHYSS